ncbi:MAG: response regulator transcription factor [Fluviicola sp.]|nr:response regulator transcription factor [Fluviicola sp.]MBP6271636.1 response regulator transcription factor [Fluviicola sp.]
MTEEIKVLIVDDHQLIREAWTAILQMTNRIKVIGTAETADEAYEVCSIFRPEVVLMDINLKNSNGFDATEKICNSLPKTRVIGLSLHDDVALVKKFLSKGAKGYLSKNTSREELVAAIDAVMNDKIYLAADIKEKFINQIIDTDKPTEKELTNKEIEIVTLISQGFTSKEIAEKIFISVRTVETHRHNILKKLNIPNAALLSSWAKDKGYI